MISDVILRSLCQVVGFAERDKPLKPLVCILHKYPETGIETILPKEVRVIIWRRSWVISWCVRG